MAALFSFLRSMLPAHRGRALLISGALLFEAAYYGLVSLSLKVIIDNTVTPRDAHMLWLVLGGLAGGIVLLLVIGAGRDYLYAALCAATLNELRRRVFAHLQRLSLEFYARTSIGEITARFSTDLAAVEQALVAAPSIALLPVLHILFSLGLLFALDSRLALVVLLVFPVGLIGPRLLRARAQTATYARKQEEARVLSAVQEAASAPALTRTFGLEEYLMTRFDRRMRDLAAASQRAGFLTALLERSGVIGVLLVHTLVTGVGAWLAFTSSLSIGAFVTFQALYLTISRSIGHTMQYVPILLHASAGMQRITEVLAEEVAVRDLPEAAPPAPLAREIVFEDVTFAYDGHTPQLDRLSFTIHAGESVAIVGPSGAGKSTVLMLLARLYEPTAGRILIDGQDLRHAAQAAWRRQIALVAQDTVLFNATIGDNIRLGRIDAAGEAVEEAARLAALHPLVASLPDGYEAGVGEQGGRLSGGQRQRVGLARALLRDPRLLLLDEVTSALDPETASAIHCALFEARLGRTVVAVTHRLDTVAHADRILVLEQGRLVEQGRHHDLLIRGGTYARLWEAQAEQREAGIWTK